VDVDQELSPSLQEKVTLVGELLKSFPQATSAVDQLLGLTIGRMRFERVTERIGGERVAQRDREAEQVAQLRLMDKIDGPVGVTPPVVGAIMADGGRFQQNVAQPDSGKHWYEYKAGLCLTLGTLTDANDTTAPRGDPCPEVPLSLLNFEHVETLTREIAQRTASPSRSLPGELRPDETGVLLDELRASTKLDEIVQAADKVVHEQQRSPRELPFSPKIKSREVVATTGNASEFGRLLIARAWRSGLFQAIRKGFVADGGSWLWMLFVRAFRPFGFEGILDIIHAVTYVFAAAMAERDRPEGWIIYHRWITWIWQGQVSQVIAELQARALELGEPTNTDPVTSPRRIVASTLTYLQNHQQYMNYPRYRELGLPLTSSVMESTMKELNYRVKGTEKFWSQPGAEALLQLRSDRLSDSQPLKTFWTTRQQTRSGLHARSCLTPA
jgi:hypothetical protein